MSRLCVPFVYPQQNAHFPFLFEPFIESNITLLGRKANDDVPFLVTIIISKKKINYFAQMLLYVKWKFYCGIWRHRIYGTVMEKGYSHQFHETTC